jgi:hypothetical protein
MLKKVFARYQVVAKSGTFKIPPKLKAHVRINGGLDNVENWEAKVWIGNSCGSGDAKKGKWGKVGYVAFDAKTGTVVPIARSDEHHTGYDLINEFEEKKIIPRAEWVTIWAIGDGGNYANKDELKKLIPVYKRWLELGGMNGKITMWDSHHKMSFRDLIDNGPVLKTYKGELAPTGKKLVDLLEKAAKLFAKAAGGAPAQSKQLSKIVFDLADFVQKNESECHMLGYEVGRNDEGIQKIKEAASHIANGEDLDKNMDCIFGFKGLKNAIHTSLKNVVEKQDRFYASYLKTLFGDDLEFAKKEFDRISSI